MLDKYKEINKLKKHKEGNGENERVGASGKEIGQKFPMQAKSKPALAAKRKKKK